ncbi:MAG: hypothetical protein GY913_27070 [Proteobacteria bacterium]|nr:hypothetical protein [Pseudomonadota bacterium]MCP4920577.1 hypothetical protein [Pseudomonadota bacterium]
MLPDDPSRTAVRRARDQRPGLVLIVLDGGDTRPGLALCRALRTDRTPVPVGVLDPLGVSDSSTIEVQGADGYLRGVAPGDELARWAVDVQAGRGRVEEHPVARRGLLSRLFGRR